MFDSLAPTDEPAIREYMAQGLEREEAIAYIFEEKYGKVGAC
jgi:hypothetical protein